MASGLVYWLVMLNWGEEEEVVVSASIKKVDKSATLMKATMENNTVFNSDYVGELVTAACLITGLVLYKLLKYRCKVNVEPTPPVQPDVIPNNHAIIDNMPHSSLPHPYPYMNYNYSAAAPPSYSSLTTTSPAPASTSLPAPTLSAASFPVATPPTTEQVTVLPSTSTAKFKKKIPVLESSTSESDDSECSEVIVAKAAAQAAKQKRKRQRKKEKKDKENTLTATDNTVPSTAPSTT